MCDLPDHPCGQLESRPHAYDWSRRRFLQAVGTTGALVIGHSLIAPLAASAAQVGLEPVDANLSAAVEFNLRPSITPRSEWSPDRPPVGALEAEAPGDLRFLLCHHTAQPNRYGEESVDRYLRDIYGFHTSSTKGWPDIAYNFLIDRFGGIWEGRTGSIEAPIKGSATGGSQGFAMLCCWLGNHHEEAPTPAAQKSMVDLLAWLAHNYDIDTAPGDEAEFISRGSHLHAVGKSVVTSTISGHRDMSATVCPGDFAYPLVKSEFQATVTSLRNTALAAVIQSTTTTSVTTPSAVPEVTAPASISPLSGTTDENAAKADEIDEDQGFDVDWPLIGAAGAGVAAISAAMWHQQRSESS